MVSLGVSLSQGKEKPPNVVGGLLAGNLVAALIPEKTGSGGNETLMSLHPNFNRSASLRLERVASHLNQAGQQLAAAGNAALDRHNREKLYRLARDLEEFSQPVARMVAALERGGCR
jgi:hypothetical protein